MRRLLPVILTVLLVVGSGRCIVRSRITGSCISASLALRSSGSRRSLSDCYLSLESLEQRQPQSAGLWLAQFESSSGSCHQFAYQSVCRLLNSAGSDCEAMLSSRLSLHSALARFSAVWEAAGASMDSLLCGQAAPQATAVQWTDDGARLANSTDSKLYASNVQNLTLQSGAALTWLVRASRSNGGRCFMEFMNCLDQSILGANLWEWSEVSTGTVRHLLSRLSADTRIESLQPVLPDDPNQLVTVGVAYNGSVGQLKLFVDKRFLRPDEVSVVSTGSAVNLQSCLKIGRRSMSEGWLAGTVQVVALSMEYLSEEDIRGLFIN